MASLTIVITLGGIIFNIFSTIINMISQKFAKRDKATKGPDIPEQRA